MTKTLNIQTKLSDSRATPSWLMKLFDEWFDPCPLNPNPLIDGLELEWKDKTFVNPPYSNPSKWVYKAIEESKKGKTIVLLMRFDPTTKYFRALIDYGCHIFYSGERLEFINPFVETNCKSPFPSILIVLDGLDNFNKKLNEEKKYEI